jgi:hypothetical protein
MIAATVRSVVADYGPFIGLVGVALTLYVNGGRSERQRRREIHAQAIAAVVSYLEVPYRIHRRRCEPEHRSSERARLSDDFSAIQVELACCEALIRADRDVAVRDIYQQLIETLRQVASSAAGDAWKAEPVSRDDDMALGELHRRLAPVRDA